MPASRRLALYSLGDDLRLRHAHVLRNQMIDECLNETWRIIGNRRKLGFEQRPCHAPVGKRTMIKIENYEWATRGKKERNGLYLYICVSYLCLGGMIYDINTHPHGALSVEHTFSHLNVKCTARLHIYKLMYCVCIQFRWFCFFIQIIEFLFHG